jgi:AcrR family transcriptional regulator
MPRTSAAVAAETARQIVDAATAVFASVGYGEASVDEIARRAGVTRGAVYHHYDGKAGLFRAVAFRAQELVATRVVAAAGESDDPVGQLRSGCHAFLDAITDGPTARILLVEAPAALGWQAWRDGDAATSVKELREAIDAVGSLGAVEAEAATRLLSGAMNDAALWLGEHPSDDEARTAAHGILDRLIDAVAG